MDNNNLDINAFLLKALLNNGSMPRAPGILGELEQQITSSLRKMMNIEDTQTTDLNAQISTLKNDIAQKNSIIADFSKQIMDFKTAASQKDDVISSNSRQLTEARASVAQKETSIADMSKQNIDLGLAKSRNETLICELRAQLITIQSDCAAKDTVIGNLNSEIARMKSEHQRTLVENSILTTDFGNYKKQVDEEKRMIMNAHRGELETMREEMKENNRIVLDKMTDMKSQMTAATELSPTEISDIKRHISERMIAEQTDEISLIFSE
jgi:chromosome segregation ATPase